MRSPLKAAVSSAIAVEAIVSISSAVRGESSFDQAKSIGSNQKPASTTRPRQPIQPASTMDVINARRVRGKSRLHDPSGSLLDSSGSSGSIEKPPPPIATMCPAPGVEAIRR
jgi:hypothetical protein